MTDFDIVVIRSERSAVVQVRGELDLITAPRLDEQLESLAGDGALDLTLDLADLSFIDSSGLQALVAAHKRLRELGGDLGLRSPSPSTRKVLEITGLTSVLGVAIDGAGSVDAIPGGGTQCVEWQLTGEPLVGRPSTTEPGMRN